MAGDEKFKAGIQRVIDGAEKFRIALMCSEHNPLDCHRCLLVGRALFEAGVSVQHILSGGHQISQTDIEDQLVKNAVTAAKTCSQKAGPGSQTRIVNVRGRFHIVSLTARDLSQPNNMINVSTIGFTRSNAETFFERLLKAGVKKVIDVRLHNTSQLSGFAKANDLEYFLKKLGPIEYVHEPLLAPTDEILTAYKKKKGSWEIYEKQFLDLMSQRHIEHKFRQDQFDNACLLCSEAKPHHCHRRLVSNISMTNGTRL